MEGRSGLFGRVLHVNHQVHRAGGDGAGAGGRGGLLPLGSEQLRSPPPRVRRSGEESPECRHWARSGPHLCWPSSSSASSNLSSGGDMGDSKGDDKGGRGSPTRAPTRAAAVRVPVGGREGGVGSRWHRRRRNRARPRHRRCQGGCRALGGVGRGVCSPGWGLCSAPPLHASLCVVVNMRGGHNNMCNLVSVAREWRTGSASILFIRARCSLPGGGGLGPDFGGSGPVLRLQLRNSQPLGRFVTAAHLHRLGFAPFFFLPVQA